MGVKIIVIGFDYSFREEFACFDFLVSPIIYVQFLCLLVLCYADVFSKNYV